jgi:hypothetical protein
MANQTYSIKTSCSTEADLKIALEETGILATRIFTLNDIVYFEGVYTPDDIYIMKQLVFVISVRAIMRP